MASSKTSSQIWPEAMQTATRGTPPQEESITSASAYVDYILKARGIALPPIPEHCVILHSDLLIDQFRARYAHITIDIGSRRPSKIHFFTPPEGHPFAAVASYPGAPMAALLLEELIALGFQRFISVGPAGYPANGHVPPLRLGEIILVDDALIYEGTSSHYGVQTASVAPHAIMLSSLEGALRRQGVASHRCKIATTDAIYRETPAFIDEIIAHGAMAIDMEISALFSVCRFHDKPIGALLFISDIVGRNVGWDVAFVDDHVNRAEQAILPTLIDCINAP